MDKFKEPAWRKMPVSWQKDRDFQERIRAARQGDAIAALKLYIAICLKAEFHETDRLPAGSAQLSLTSLTELVDLSKPMVIAGLKLLAEWNIVVSDGGRPAILRIVEYADSKYWVKIPMRQLYGSKNEARVQTLIHLPNRRRGTLHALQLYLYLASIRDKNSNMATLSYEQGMRTLGISRNYFSSALSMLTVDLVTVRTALEVKNLTGQNFSANQYWLRGSHRDPFRPSPADTDAHEVDNWQADLYDEEDDDRDSVIQRFRRPEPVTLSELRRQQRTISSFDDD